jgi:glucokinase
MTNLEWSFSRIGLQAALELRRLEILNDFEALAWGLADFGAADREQVGGGLASVGSAIGALGPGSGLGVSSLVPHADGWTAVAGEGGHVTLAATTRKEARIIEKIRKAYGHCSAERVLSGPGLVNLHTALCEIRGEDPESPLSAADVTKRAQRGEQAAREAVAHFFAFLGTVASDLALTIGARGGIYIAGGIVPRFVEIIKKSKFRERFEAKGRYRKYMEEIPTYVLTDETPAFRGLRRVLGYR